MENFTRTSSFDFEGSAHNWPRRRTLELLESRSRGFGKAATRLLRTAEDQ